MQKQQKKISDRIRGVLYNDGIVEKALLVFFFFYLYTLYDLLSFIVLSIFLISIAITIQIELKKFKHKGLIYYLPQQLQNLLTKSSVFDIFTFFWNPNFFLYLKTFYKPFFHNISPEEAVQTLDELPNEAKNVILTKGIVYSLPSFMKQLLLPQSIYQEICQREEEEIKEMLQKEEMLMLHNCEHNQDDNCECENKKISEKDPNNSWGVVSNRKDKNQRFNNEQIYKSVIEEEDLLNITEAKQDQFYKISQKSSLNFHKNIQEDSFNNSYNNHNNDKFRNEEKRIKDRVDSIRKIMMDQPFDIKTKVIASSQDKVPKKQQQQQINQMNIEEGIQNIIEGIKKKFNNSSSDSPIGQIKSAVNLLMGVAEIKKNSNLLHKIETTKMYKYFVVSAIFLLSQYFISKKTRRWLISSTMFVAYVLSFFLTFGTMGIYIYKNVNQQQNNIDPHSKRKNKRKLQKASFEDPKYLVDDQEV